MVSLWDLLPPEIQRRIFRESQDYKDIISVTKPISEYSIWNKKGSLGDYICMVQRIQTPIDPEKSVLRLTWDNIHMNKDLFTLVIKRILILNKRGRILPFHKDKINEDEIKDLFVSKYINQLDGKLERKMFRQDPESFFKFFEVHPNDYFQRVSCNVPQDNLDRELTLKYWIHSPFCKCNNEQEMKTSLLQYITLTYQWSYP